MRPLPRRARQTSKVGHIHNQMVGHVQSLHPNKSNGKLQIHTSLGIFEREITQRRAPGGGKVSQYRVHSVGNDYLVCQLVSGSTVSGGFVYVAKPFHLRRTPFDGQSVTYVIENPPAASYSVSISYAYSSGTFRTATLGGQSEGQTIIPRFALDRDVIYAAAVEQSIGLDANGSAITLIDLNADSRAWAKVL